MSAEDILRLKLEQEKLLQEKLKLKQGLPHLYGMNWYEWAWDFFKTENHEAFLVAANQVSKSSTQIRKFIDWATDTAQWIKRWPCLAVMPVQIPNQFWYLYPTADVATIEFETKWMPFMPAGEYKNHPVFGWTDDYEKGKIKSVKFNSGVTIYFKTYSQNVQDLQSGSVYMLGFDEELPEELLGELQARLNGTDGYFSGVFTATLGQDYWRRVMEPENAEEELHATAWKTSVSLYDCQFYRDGTPSPWTPEKIARAVARCPNKAERSRRIDGRFAVSGGRKYFGFERERNVVAAFKIEADWHIVSGVDIGSGGENNHPGAIAFIAVRPDFKFGAVFKGWRGDEVTTTSGDIFLKHKELKGKLIMMSQVYDHAAKDFDTIATRNNDPFTKAQKGHDAGEALLNTLFRHGMLVIFGNDPELAKAAVEFSSLLKATPKTKAKDDFTDAIRYAAGAVPWDLSDIETIPLDPVEAAKPRPEPRKKTYLEIVDEERRAFVLGSRKEAPDPIQEELDEWNDLYGS